MNKFISLLLTLALIAVVFSACGQPRSEAPTPTPADDATQEETPGDPGDKSTSEAPQLSGELNLYTWEGMFPDEVLRSFTEETGIEINFSNFDTDETMLSRLEADGANSYDLVIADDYIIPDVISQGLAQPLDLNKIPNISNVNPVYQNQFYDTANEYTVPYGAGVQTIVYDPALVEKEITSYSDLWDPSFKDSIGIIGNYRVINGAALKVIGESYNTEDVAAIEKAGEKLLELAPNIRVIKDDNLQNDLISGEISTAIMYTSQVTLAKLSRPDLKIVFPSEGIGFGIMLQFIPAGAPNPDAAHAFIDYILRPDVAKLCFENLGYYSTNSAADPLFDDEFKEFLTLPENFGTDDIEILMPINQEANDAQSKIWTQFQSAK